LGVSAEEVLVKLLQDLFVGHQGLDELLLIGPCETVEGHLPELFKRRVFKTLVLLGAVEDFLLELLNTLVNYHVSPVELLIASYRSLRCGFVLSLRSCSNWHCWSDSNSLEKVDVTGYCLLVDFTDHRLFLLGGMLYGLELRKCRGGGLSLEIGHLIEFFL
jgi:hypothetical protein